MPRSAKASSRRRREQRLAKLGADIKIGTPADFGYMLGRELALLDRRGAKDAKITGGLSTQRADPTPSANMFGIRPADSNLPWEADMTLHSNLA